MSHELIQHVQTGCVDGGKVTLSEPPADGDVCQGFSDSELSAA